jgi:hypothetical protein
MQPKSPEKKGKVFANYSNEILNTTKKNKLWIIQEMSCSKSLAGNEITWLTERVFSFHLT